MVLVTAPASPQLLQVRLVTHNIRYATTTPSAHELPWAERRARLLAQLRFTTAGRDAFICLQEVLHGQLQDVAAGLGAAWAHVGVGRDDGAAGGEHSPVFYRRDLWRCEAARTVWLSPTPDRPSTGWDAALPRVVTAARFLRRRAAAAPAVRVVVMSTHLDHVGEVARRESAALLLALAREWGGGGGGAVLVFLAGDFNSTPDGGAYRGITDPDGGGAGGGMVDLSTVLPEEERYGNADITYTSFGEPEETPKRIDFLFLKDPSGEVQVTSFGILANKFDDGVFLSDHRAVVADVEVPVLGSV